MADEKPTDAGELFQPWHKKVARIGANQKYKRQRFKQAKSQGKEVCCEVCGWKSPIGLSASPWKLLEAHHIVPVCCGGTNDDANFLLLCPNHHAVADHLGRFKKVYSGPRTRKSLIKLLREFDNNSEETENDKMEEIAKMLADEL